MTNEIKQSLIEQAKALLDAGSSCPEATDAAKSYIDSVGTDKEADALARLVAEAKEDITTADGLLEFAKSDAAKAAFGENAPGFLTHAEELKASGAKYCDCPACKACENIIELSSKD